MTTGMEYLCSQSNAVVLVVLVMPFFSMCAYSSLQKIQHGGKPVCCYNTADQYNRERL